MTDQLTQQQVNQTAWAACDTFRGVVDAGQYKDYILTLLFVKYVSDKAKADPNSLIDVPQGGSFDSMHGLKGDPEIGDKLKAYTPKLRNNIMMLLSSKKASDLLSREGKEKLAAEIRDMVNDVLEPGSAGKKDAPAKEVLFTSFIIQ